MKLPFIAFASAPLLLISSTASAQSAPTDAAGYDVPALKAGEILQLPYLASPNHNVRDEVVPYMGANRFIIDSQFGTFVAQGNQMLEDRVREIQALAKLREMSNTSQYAEGFKEAAKLPFDVAGDFLTAPVDTVVGVPKGVGKFIGRIGRGTKEAVSGRDRSTGEGGLVKNAAGVSQTKRELCAELGVNPYSSNEVLQAELDRVAWVIFAGKLTVKAATLPVGGAAGSAISAVSAIDATTSLVATSSPLDLRKVNLGKLKDMGISAKDAEAFLANPHLSPTHQTRIVTALEKMTGVKGRDIIIRDATAMCENEADATFYEQTARLIGHAHAHGLTVDHIVLLNGFPVCIAPDGGVMVALQWDYAMWSPRSESFANGLENVKINGVKAPSVTVVLTGAMSPTLRQQLDERGFRVQDKLIKGPLN
ncbi:MAG: hypothetical protein K1X78_11255 [Verrucomicrobiaceae bacterium]|nr:hypothetical protein [Verrucomicrobiaceae bacterium]